MKIMRDAVFYKRYINLNVVVIGNNLKLRL